MLPVSLATYLNKSKPDSVLKAAQLADDYVLTHQGRALGVRSGVSWDSGARPLVVRYGSPRKNGQPGRPARSRGPNVCHFCRGEGHWKDHCPLLKSRNSAPSPAPSMLCTTAHGSKTVEPVHKDSSGFEPFIADARVSLEGRDESVLIKVLRDTGAKHSFIWDSVLTLTLTLPKLVTPF